MRVRLGLVWLLSGFALAACGIDGSKDCLSDPLRCFDGGTEAPAQGAVGKACESNDQCMNALRLACVDGLCALSEDLTEDDPCKATLECGAGLYCSVDDGRSVCERAGTGNEGARCESTADCARNLVCGFDGGLAKHCLPAGDGDIGTPCAGPSDCLAGLYCTPALEGLERVCAALPKGADAFVDWKGLDCPADIESARAYFEVPRGPGDKDFFRLPFPNDVRRRPTGLDLGGFPSPGDLFGAGFDLVGSYVAASEAGLDGFATNPVIYFRFSQPYQGAGKDTILLYDIDPDSPEYGRARSRSWGTSAGDVTNYVCRHWLNVRTPIGEPLRPGTTYAALLTTGIQTKQGAAFARDADFSALLASTPPEESELADAYAAYAPLRAFLADADNDDVAAASVLNAAVFTTVDPHAVVRATRAAIRAQSPPEVKDVTVCGAGVRSPCDDGAARVCGASDEFVEIHGRISLPIFQAGTAPYERTGGGFTLENGVPKLERREDVCFGLSLPKTAMPEGGYPLAIYAHGTGGSFASGLADLGSVAAAAGAAVLSIDLPVHGARANGSTRPADELFFNFANPAAARDNVTQGAADLFSLAHFARSLDAPASSPFGQALKFDAARIVYFGHSQGATHVALSAPFESDVRGVLLSGVGGDLSESFATKRAPVDLAASLHVLVGDRTAAPEGELCPPVLGDDGQPRTTADGEVLRYQCIATNHPVYGLLQAYFERVDPVNFAGLLPKPPAGVTTKHVFMTYGRSDTYTPESTQKAYAVAASLDLVAPALVPIGGAEAVPAPLRGNVKVGESSFTQGVRQYEPAAGEDGHFVYEGPAKADWTRFLNALLAGETPAIGE